MALNTEFNGRGPSLLVALAVTSLNLLRLVVAMMTGRESPPFKRASLPVLLILTCVTLPGCSSSDYSATVTEARVAAGEAMAESGASALALVLVDGEGIILTECLGEADKEAGTAVVPGTLFGIGSISKMFATIAVMKLEEGERVHLDAPLVSSLPRFSMISPEYRDITVRMLLNHSSGLPGGTILNSVTTAPFPAFADQVMASLSHQRLKHTPGYMNVYCNDGFTMVENLVKALTGKDYPEYVKEAVLGPLGMTGSDYVDHYLPEGSFAKTYTGDTPHPFTYMNFYATGGLLSSAADMAKLMRMLINGGVHGEKRFLSSASITAMSRDQTLGTFNPEPSDFVRYGLGWDTVTQAGLRAVGIGGWQKGGAIDGAYGPMYRSTMIVSPEAGLGVFVVMASNNITSDLVDKVGERVILRALVDSGILGKMPDPLSQDPLPVDGPTAEEKSAFSGFYGTSGGLYRLGFDADDFLRLDSYGDDGWTPLYGVLKKRSDGWYAADDDAITALRLLTASERRYVARRKRSGAGHYTSTTLLAQKLDARDAVSKAWRERLATRWLSVNDETLNFYPDLDVDTSLFLTAVDGLPGYLLGNSMVLRDMDPPVDDRLDGMFLQIPQTRGRDLVDAAVERREGGDWLRLGSILYRPLSGIPSVSAGTTAVTIGSEGFSEWRKLPVSGSVCVDNAEAWKLFDGHFQLKDYGRGNGCTALPGSGEAAYLVCSGAPGTRVSLYLSP